MNLPQLTGYFRYPNLAGTRTRGYFAAFPALLPVSAIIEVGGTNQIVSATAIFDGQSIAVIQAGNVLQAQISTDLTDIGRQIDVQWTLRFQQSPTVITYTHRIIVTSQDLSLDPIPTLNGNPCNIPCGTQTIDATGFANPLYFAVSGVNTSYEGFSFVSTQISSGNLVNWCNNDAAGFIDIEPYTLPPYTGTPNWVERSRICVQNVPRTSSDAYVFQVDDNTLSPTFGQARQITVTDAVLCPLGDTSPIWENDGLPYCQPEPRNDCRKLQNQIDTNPISLTFQSTQVITLPASPNDCVECPPTSLLPDYQDTGEWRCAQPNALGRDSDVAEKKQIDRNPFSPTFNDDRWVSIGRRPDLCPIDTNPNNREVWVDSTTPECGLITRCKFDTPRPESTRQKQQTQVNPALPNVGAIRWVDLPPDPNDALICPVEISGVWVAVCPEQIRCKFAAPRVSPLTERLEVDVNPNSATFGQQQWRDYIDDPVLCPFTPIGQDEHQISLHFRAEDNFRVLELSSRLENLSATNIFNNAIGVTYQYAPVHSVTNWSIYPETDLASLQASISIGGNIYSIRVNVSGYVLGSDAGIILTHTVNPASVPPPVYATLGISQDFVVWHKDDDVVYNSVTSSTGGTLSYALITAANSIDFINPSITTLSALNSAIAALPSGTQYGVLIYIQYAAGQNTTNITVNTTIP